MKNCFLIGKRLYENKETATDHHSMIHIEVNYAGKTVCPISI